MQGPCAALRLWTRLSLAALLFFVPLHAQAERSEHRRSDYDRLVEEAVFEYRRQHFDEALALFLRAHELEPSARTQRGIGMVEFELRHYVESITALRLSLREEHKPLTGALRERTERLLHRAESFIGYVRLESDAPITSMLVDGTETAYDAGVPLMLSVGDHDIELRAVGFLPQRRVLRVRGGERSVLSLAFTKVALAERKVLAPERATSTQGGRDLERAKGTGISERPARARPLYRRPWLWVGVSIAAASAAAVAVGLRTREPGHREPIADSPYTGLRGP